MELPSADEAVEAPALFASRVGAELRAARQRLGWSLPDVAATLRIRLPFLEAIEDGRLADLPGNAYAMGFLRSYSGLLGLDAAEVARRFRAEASEIDRKPDLSFPAPVPERGVPAGAVVLLGALIAVGAYGTWYKWSGDIPAAAPVVPAVPERLAPLADQAMPPPGPSPPGASPGASSGALPGASPGAASPQHPAVLPPPGPAANGASSAAPGANPPLATPLPASPSLPIPAATSPSPAALASADASRMVLHLKADSWVQVREKQGPVLLNRVMRAGENWPVPKGQSLLLTTGNAGGTEVVVDGVASPSLGAMGLVRRDVPLDPDPTKPGAGVAPQAPKPPSVPAAAPPQ